MSRRHVTRPDPSGQEKGRGSAVGGAFHAHAPLLNPANLRKASVAEVQTTRPIIVNVADIPLLREPIDRAYAEGYAQGLAKGRAARLAKGQLLLVAASVGPLPDDLLLGLMRLEPDDVSLVMQLVRHVLPADQVESMLRRNPSGSVNIHE